MLLDQPKLHLDSKLVAPSVVSLSLCTTSILSDSACSTPRILVWILTNRYQHYFHQSINPYSRGSSISRLNEKTDSGVHQPGSLVFPVLSFRLWRSQGGLEGLGSNHSRTSICNFCWLQFRCT